MKIEMRKTAEIKPYERNPRINDAAVDAVARSIKEFGWRQPIVVDAEGVIIAATRAGRPRRSSASTRCPSTSPRT